MPVYVYHCTNCGIQFDKLQSFTEQPLLRCPECGKHKLRKVYQPVGIVFKGSGFYATDHHSPSGQNPQKNEKDKKEISQVVETTSKETKTPIDNK
jgi:putative FmdB family regulatory protein